MTSNRTTTQIHKILDPPAALAAKYYVWKSSHLRLVLALPCRHENNQINLHSSLFGFVLWGMDWMLLCSFTVSSLMFNQWEQHDCSVPRSQEAWLKLAGVHPPLNDSPNRSRSQDAAEATRQLNASWGEGGCSAVQCKHFSTSWTMPVMERLHI